MPESCTWALELFIGLQSLLLLPPSKTSGTGHNNYIQLSVMIHSGPKAGITAWGEIVLFAPLLGLPLRVRSSLEIRDREKQTDTNYHHPSPSTLHISPTRYSLAHTGGFAHKTTFTCSVEQSRPTNKWKSLAFCSVLIRRMTSNTHGHQMIQILLYTTVDFHHYALSDVSHWQWKIDVQTNKKRPSVQYKVWK